MISWVNSVMNGKNGKPLKEFTRAYCATNDHYIASYYQGGTLILVQTNLRENRTGSPRLYRLKSSYWLVHRRFKLIGTSGWIIVDVDEETINNKMTILTGMLISNDVDAMIKGDN